MGSLDGAPTLAAVTARPSFPHMGHTDVTLAHPPATQSRRCHLRVKDDRTEVPT